MQVNAKILLLSAKESNIFLHENQLLYRTDKIDKDFLKGKEHNLYVITDEGVKEGDFFYTPKEVSTNGKELIEQLSKDCSTFEGCKKIIATTDKTLTDIIPVIENSRIVNIFHKYLPSPSIEFVHEYIKSYNKNDKIVDVMVEYTYNVVSNFDHPTKEPGERYNFRPKLDNQNNIIIH
jgi:hypothetical protein